MAISLSRLFVDSKRTYEIKLHAGKIGLKSLVRWVHIIEDTEVSGFIHGNELVFTTGITQKNNEWILDFVKTLKEKGAVGLVLNVGPYIKDIPLNVIEYCDSINFPLFTIPWDKRLIDVTYDFCHRIIANEEHELGLATALKNIIFNPEEIEENISVLSRRGFNDDTLYTLMVVKAYSNGEVIPSDVWHLARFDIQSMLNHIEKPMFMFIQQNSFVLVGFDLDKEKYEKKLEKIISQIKQKLFATEVYVGISNQNLGYKGINLGYRQAVAACDISICHNNSITIYENMGLYKIAYSVSDKDVLREFYDSVLKRIVEQDKQNNTDYLDTLECYLKNNCSVQKVSEILNVHRNTVNYKIKYLRNNFGLSFSNANIAELITAFICRDIIKN